METKLEVQSGKHEVKSQEKRLVQNHTLQVHKGVIGLSSLIKRSSVSLKNNEPKGGKDNG